MKKNDTQPLAAIEPPRRRLVRVKMRRRGLNYGTLYPPDGEAKSWWRALKNALGTSSSSFVNASLAQLQAAARLPDGMVSEVAMNAAFALIQCVAPKNEIEGVLAIQMACSHSAAMAALGRLTSAGSLTFSAYSTAAATLMRSYAQQLETLRRLRGSGAPHVKVEHVHINDEGRAVIGNVALDQLSRAE